MTARASWACRSHPWVLAVGEACALQTLKLCQIYVSSVEYVVRQISKGLYVMSCIAYDILQLVHVQQCMDPTIAIETYLNMALHTATVMKYIDTQDELMRTTSIADNETKYFADEPSILTGRSQKALPVFFDGFPVPSPSVVYEVTLVIIMNQIKSLESITVVESRDVPCVLI